MKRRLICLIVLVNILVAETRSQDTFSIVAIDSTTGEVGSAGASCVDLFNTSLSDDDFLGKLVPGVGAINTQAWYLPANQNNATERMKLGETPDQIIDWLKANDVQSTPEKRQYGIVAMVDGSPKAAAFTGVQTDEYRGHIIGSYYSIQGNILSGKKVLDSMESKFLNAKGDLACRLMAALQGANMLGADARCASNGTSSLFAFVKVAQSWDSFEKPSFVVTVRTRNNDRIEPVDSLQIKFDLVKGCWPLSPAESPDFEKFFLVFPNPTLNTLFIQNKQKGTSTIYLIDNLGRKVYSNQFSDEAQIDLSDFGKGPYYLILVQSGRSFVKRIVLGGEGG